MEFRSNISPIDVIKKGAFGGTYFRDIYSNVINKVFRFVGEENGVKYLKIDKGNKKLEDSILSFWNEVFIGIKYNIKKINHGCKSLDDCKRFSDYEEFDKI